MTPTREQVIQMAADAGFVGYGEDMGEYSIPATAFISRLGRVIEAATEAGRAQGLREAREVCEKEAENFGGVAAGPFATDFGKHTHNAMAAGAKNCAAAIKQLEGK